MVREGGEELCPCQMSILINILLACHGKFFSLDKNREVQRTEHVVFIIGHYNHSKIMSFLFNSILHFSHNYHMVN